MRRRRAAGRARASAGPSRGCARRPPRARRAGCARCARRTSCQSHGPSTRISAPRDRAGADEGVRGADVVEQDQRADHHEHDPEHRQVTARPQRAAAAERPRRRRATISPAPRTTAPDRPSAKKQRHGGDDDERQAPTTGVLAAGVRPEGEVEEDAGAAREREQGEDEPDERRVDVQASTRRRRRRPRSRGRRRSVRRGGRGSGSSRPDDVDAAGSNPCVEVEGVAVAGVHGRVAPVVVRLRTYRSPTFAWASTTTEASAARSPSARRSRAAP